MTISFYDMKSKHHGDRLTLVDNGALVIYPIHTGGIEFQYNETTASFETWISGTKYAFLALSDINEWYESEDIEAEMETVDLLNGNDIMQRATVDSVYLKTGISNASIDIHKQSDFFTEESSTIKDALELYNDPDEINSGVSIAVFGGSRSAIVHSDIPVGTGDTKGFTLQIKATNEANIHAMRMVMLDNNQGGDR